MTIFMLQVTMLLSINVEASEKILFFYTVNGKKIWEMLLFEMRLLAIDSYG